MTVAPLLPEIPVLVTGNLRRMIPAAEYQQLIVSHRKLVRADEPALGLRGLKDLDSGEWFLTDERKLHEPRRK